MRLQDIVTDFRWRIGADLIQGYLTVASCKIDSVSYDCDVFEPPAMSDESCDAFDQSVIDKITKEVGQELGSLASNREGIKKEMFDIIVKFRDNDRNGSRKLAQLKTVFVSTFLNLSDDCNCPKLKKKCGKLWSCIMYAICENVQIESFSLSHLERMKAGHNAYVLSQNCHEGAEESFTLYPRDESQQLLVQRTTDCHEGAEESFKFPELYPRDESQQLLVQRPTDIQKSERLPTFDQGNNSVRKSERQLQRSIVEPVHVATPQEKSSSKSKQKNYVKIINVDSC